jgi:predicted transcriptional regulator
MDAPFPSAADVRAALDGLTLRQIDELAGLSGVPPTTIYKIKRGETENPGIDTCRKVMQALPRMTPQAPAGQVEPIAKAA